MAGEDRQSREERLAAKLRENLRRRKAQAREQAGALGAAQEKPPAAGLSKGEPGS